MERAVRAVPARRLAVRGARGARGGQRSALGARPKGARELAREILQMTQEEFSRAFSKSPMKRAKLRGLKRNAAVVLGNVGARNDARLLERLRPEEPDEVVREHIEWAIARLGLRR